MFVYMYVCMCVCVYDSIKSHENNKMVSSGSKSHCTKEREIAVETIMLILVLNYLKFP